MPLNSLAVETGRIFQYKIGIIEINYLKSKDDDGFIVTCLMIHLMLSEE